MDQNIRASLQISAFYNFAFIIFITSISQSVTLMAIVFGDLSGKEVKPIPLGALKFVFAGIFVILAIFQLLAIY